MPDKWQIHVSEFFVLPYVLDLGCGRGNETIQAAMLTGPEGKAVGIDITQAMIDTAHANAKGIGVSAVTEKEYLDSIMSSGFKNIEILKRREYVKNGYDFISLTIMATKQKYDGCFECLL